MKIIQHIRRQFISLISIFWLFKVQLNWFCIYRSVTNTRGQIKGWGRATSALSPIPIPLAYLLYTGKCYCDRGSCSFSIPLIYDKGGSLNFLHRLRNKRFDKLRIKFYVRDKSYLDREIFKLSYPNINANTWHLNDFIYNKYGNYYLLY